MPKEIIIEIGDDGNIDLQVDGCKGKGCEAESKFIEDALGMEGGKRKRKTEYYAATEVVKQKQKV